MQVNPYTLTFTGADRLLEPGFLKDYCDKSIRLFRIALLLGCGFYAIFGILDALLLPEIKERIWFIRFAVVCPALITGVVFSYSSIFSRCWQLVLSIIMLLAGLGIIAMIVLAPPPVNYTYYAGLMLVLVYSYTVPRARFLWASATCWTLVICYEITAFMIIDTPVNILINNNFFFISANLIGMIASYLMEYSARKNYYLFHLLEKVNDKLQEKNLALEQALENVKTLSGFIPICMHCKKIRDDQGYWNQLENYISSRSEAQFSHSLCPDCMKRLYPEFSLTKGKSAVSSGEVKGD